MGFAIALSRQIGEFVTIKNQNNDTFSLAHTTWKCKYHIVFTPKYHRKIIYRILRSEIGKVLRELYKRKDVEIVEAYVMPDHIHMLVRIPPNVSVSRFTGYLKGKSTMIIFERYAKLKYKYENRHFRSRGYYVSTVGHNKQGVQRYIQNQEKEDNDNVTITYNFTENYTKYRVTQEIIQKVQRQSRKKTAYNKNLCSYKFPPLPP